MTCRNLCSFIFVLGLVLPPFTLAQGAEKENNTVCNNHDVKAAGDKFFEVFNDMLRHDGEETSNKTAIRLTSTISEFIKIANESCYNDTGSHKREATKFVKLVKFSVRHGLFKEFVENGGVACIAAVKDKITECVKHEVGAFGGSNEMTENRKYDNLWKMTYLTIDARSCRNTHRTKKCTLKAMREERRDCRSGNDNVLYVGSLFDYMLEGCSRRVGDWGKKNDEGPEPPRDEKGTRVTHALLSVLLVFAVMAMFYTCVRDCRAPRGPWKALNERISMSMTNRRRRRSLVDNEARHET